MAWFFGIRTPRLSQECLEGQRDITALSIGLRKGSLSLIKSEETKYFWVPWLLCNISYIFKELFVEWANCFL